MTVKMKESLPAAVNGVMQLSPAVVPKDIYHDDTQAAVAKTDLVPAGASFLRVICLDFGIIFRWHVVGVDTTAVTIANFDEVCPPGIPMDFVVPDKNASSARKDQISMLGDGGTAKVRLIWK